MTFNNIKPNLNPIQPMQPTSPVSKDSEAFRALKGVTYGVLKTAETISHFVACASSIVAVTNVIAVFALMSETDGKPCADQENFSFSKEFSLGFSNRTINHFIEMMAPGVPECHKIGILLSEMLTLQIAALSVSVVSCGVKDLTRQLAAQCAPH